MIGQSLSRQNSAFSSVEIWKGILSFRTEVSVKRRADLLTKTPRPSPAKRIFSSGQTVARDGRQAWTEDSS